MVQAVRVEALNELALMFPPKLSSHRQADLLLGGQRRGEQVERGVRALHQRPEGGGALRCDELRRLQQQRRRLIIHPGARVSSLR
jgi:hypothetical protein